MGSFACSGFQVNRLICPERGAQHGRKPAAPRRAAGDAGAVERGFFFGEFAIYFVASYAGNTGASVCF